MIEISGPAEALSLRDALDDLCIRAGWNWCVCQAEVSGRWFIWLGRP